MQLPCVSEMCSYPSAEPASLESQSNHINSMIVALLVDEVRTTPNFRTLCYLNLLLIQIDDAKAPNNNIADLDVIQRRSRLWLLSDEELAAAQRVLTANVDTNPDAQATLDRVNTALLIRNSTVPTTIPYPSNEYNYDIPTKNSLVTLSALMRQDTCDGACMANQLHQLNIVTKNVEWKNLGDAFANSLDDLKPNALRDLREEHKALMAARNQRRNKARELHYREQLGQITPDNAPELSGSESDEEE